MMQDPKDLAEARARARALRAKFFPHLVPKPALVYRAPPLPAPRPQPPAPLPTVPVPPFDPQVLDNAPVGCRGRVIVGDALVRHQVPHVLFFSNCHRHRVVLCRREAIYLVAAYTFLSYSAIGRLLGLDHTTTRHAVLRQDELLGTHVHDLRRRP